MINFKALSDKYNTPLYIYDFDRISDRYNSLKQAFRAKKSFQTIRSYSVVLVKEMTK